MPLVSVVMPSYNQARFLGEAVASVLGQTLADLELIVVNDGSADDTADVLAAVDDPRLRVLHQENQGASAALNAGFAQARGRLYTWLASDNAYAPRFLEVASPRLLTRPDLGLVYACFENMDEHGALLDYTFLEPWHPGLLLANPGAVGVAFLYRSELARAVGPYRDLVCNDLDFWLRAARHFSFGFIPEVLARNRKHAAMQTLVRRQTLLREVEHCLAEERALTGAGADPCLGQCVLDFQRISGRLARALQLRLSQMGAGNRTAVAGPPAISAAVAAALSARGIVARAVDEDQELAPGEAFLALDPETEARIRRRGQPVVALGSAERPTVAMF